MRYVFLVVAVLAAIVWMLVWAAGSPHHWVLWIVAGGVVGFLALKPTTQKPWHPE